MSADLSTATRIAETLAFSQDTAPRNPDALECRGTLQLKVVVEVADVLALLRTAVILARHFRLPLLVDVPDALAGRASNTDCGMQMHFGPAPCSAMLAALLDSVAQRLRKHNPGAGESFLAEFGFSAESGGLLFRIQPSPARYRHSK